MSTTLAVMMLFIDCGYRSRNVDFLFKLSTGPICQVAQIGEVLKTECFDLTCVLKRLNKAVLRV